MKDWTEIDKKKLQIGYQEGVSLKILARVLNRTPTAVSKALTRFGVRPLGARSPGIRAGCVPSGKLTCRELMRIFEAELGKEHASPAPLDAGESSSQPSQDYQRRDILEPGILGWVSFETVIKFLKQKGYHIKKCGNLSRETKNRLGSCEYYLNERPYGSQEILLMANRIRFLHGEDPFLVEEITE